jgi:hypothetical protein
MKYMRYLNPFLIRSAAREIGRLREGGGPARIRLARVGEPRGIVIPTAEIELEVQAKDGTVTTYKPLLPVPWPYAWSWRLARLLKVPLVRSLDPEGIRFSVGVPRRS